VYWDWIHGRLLPEDTGIWEFKGEAVLLIPKSSLWSAMLIVIGTEGIGLDLVSHRIVEE